MRAVPGLGTLGHKVCVPQADPTHYAEMVGRGGGTALGLNVRCQRLDQWLCCNAARRLRCCCFFADFECSVYGRPKVGFSPLRDLQRFLRAGYARVAGCLLAVTLNFRDPTWYKDPAAPRLHLADLQAFVTAEAHAVGLRCAVIETVSYGMTFCLFELSSDAASSS